MPDKRLIDANALDVIRFIPTGGEPLTAGERGWNECILFLQTKSKTIDAVEVVHAMWMKELRGIVRCSYCGRGYRITNGGANVLKFFYCPNCGAKMDENKKEVNP